MPPCPPPLDCVDATLNEQGLHSAPLSLPPASASTPTSGAVGASGNCRYGKSPALKFRLQRSPSSRRRHPPSSCVPCLYRNVVYPQQYPLLLRTFHPLVYSVKHPAAPLNSYVDCARVNIPMRPGMRLHGWRFPFL